MHVGAPADIGNGRQAGVVLCVGRGGGGGTDVPDAAGNPIAWLYSQRRFEVPTHQIADTMKLAIVSIEDKRFAEHNGVDWPGTLTGLSGYLTGNLDTRGGSTIEQQYVKNY